MTEQHHTAAKQPLPASQLPCGTRWKEWWGASRSPFPRIS